MVKPGDPAWLVNDIKGAEVLARGSDGKMRYGKATLKAGCVVWYDQKWNDKTVKADSQ